MSRPSVADLSPLVKSYYRKPGYGVGGNLHIVLEDGNVADDHVRFCLEQAREANDTDGVVLAEMLLQMSKSQRRKMSKIDHSG